MCSFEHLNEMISLPNFNPASGFPFLLEETLGSFPSKHCPAGPALPPSRQPSLSLPSAQPSVPSTCSLAPACRSHLTVPTPPVFLHLCMVVSFSSFRPQFSCLLWKAFGKHPIKGPPTGHSPIQQSVPVCTACTVVGNILVYLRYQAV